MEYSLSKLESEIEKKGFEKYKAYWIDEGCSEKEAIVLAYEDCDQDKADCGLFED